MKVGILFLLLLLSGCQKPCDCPDSTVQQPRPLRSDEYKVVSPRELASLITEVLEQLKPEIVAAGIPFEGAELELAASEEASGGIGVKVPLVDIEAGVSLETEKTITVTYELKPMVEKAEEVSSELVTTERTLQVPNLNKNQKIARLRNLALPQNSTLLRFKQSGDIDGLEKLIEEKKKRRTVIKRYIGAPQSGPQSILVTTIRKAIEEYNAIKGDFGQTCFAVEMAFGLKFKANAEVEIQIVKAELSGGIGRSHSLKMSFGKCN